MVATILQNALFLAQETFGQVTLHRTFARSETLPGTGSQEWDHVAVMLPGGLSFCDTCLNLFVGSGLYCDAHKPVTVQQPTTATTATTDAPDPVPAAGG